MSSKHLTPQQIAAEIEHLDQYDFGVFVGLLNGILNESDKQELREGLK